MGGKKQIIIGLASLTIVVAATIGLNMRSKSVPSLPQTCSNGQPSHAALSTNTNPNLKKLSEYEAVCHGAVVDRLMLFAAMPTSSQEATEFATDMSERLKEFASEHITPLVVFEPKIDLPTVLADIKSGKHDTALTTYFTTLKKQGITNQQMGTWVLFPEANTPTWRTTDPTDFTANVAKVAEMQKDVFSASKTSILLNNRSHPNGDTDWSKGEQKSLIPYVKDIPPGLIDSFGYQGFPHVSPANVTPKVEQLKTEDFLPPQLAVDAAQELNIKDVWLNTGTFKRMYADSKATEITLTADDRKKILDDISTEAAWLYDQGLHVSVNLFSEDKSDGDEHADWSYWQAGEANSSSDTKVFDLFVRQLRADNIGFSLYDHTK